MSIWANGIQLWDAILNNLVGINKIQPFQSITLLMVTCIFFYILNYTLHSGLQIKTFLETLKLYTYKQFRFHL